MRTDVSTTDPEAERVAKKIMTAVTDHFGGGRGSHDRAIAAITEILREPRKR